MLPFQRNAIPRTATKKKRKTFGGARDIKDAKLTSLPDVDAADEGYGTELTEYGKKRVSQRAKTFTIGEGLPGLESSLIKRLRERGEARANIGAPTLMADEEATKKSKRKSVSARRKKGGRVSTILSESLG
ncbi:hypothetical protein KA005_07745 [bacterium]|nr:hypothetical protein [bacterium]